MRLSRVFGVRMGQCLAAALVAFGVVRVAAAGGPCDFDIRRDSNTGKDHKFNGCNPNQVCHTEGSSQHYCTGASWTNPVGEVFGYCRCAWSFANPQCIPGFRPDSGTPTIGTGTCVPYTCSFACELSLVDIGDPEVPQIQCSCP
jgi:hypothetical protein